MNFVNILIEYFKGGKISSFEVSRNVGDGAITIFPFEREADEGKVPANGKDLFLYFNDAMKSSQAPEHERALKKQRIQGNSNVSRQLDPKWLDSFTSEKIRIKFNHNIGEQRKSKLTNNEILLKRDKPNERASSINENKPNIIDDFYHNDGSPNQRGLQIINSGKSLHLNRSPVVGMRGHGNHHHPHVNLPQRLPNSYRNQFYINQSQNNENDGDIFDDEKPMEAPSQKPAGAKVQNNWERTKFSLNNDSIDKPRSNELIYLPESLTRLQKFNQNKAFMPEISTNLESREFLWIDGSFYAWNLSRTIFSKVNL